MKVVVGQGSCGVATGARKTSDELERLIAEKGLTNVAVDLTGCVAPATWNPSWTCTGTTAPFRPVM